MTSAPVLAGVSALLFLLLLLSIFRVNRKTQLVSDQLRQQNRQLSNELQKTSKQLLEVRSVVVGLGQRVNEQHDIMQHLTERISELEQADGDGRMYSRASKMVQLGADINELIQECELPKAEAELMMSLQNKLTGKEKIPPLGAMPERSAQRRTPIRNQIKR